MVPTEAAFLERICAEPENDGPRLIFADWLDERNDPRGEFIRVQVALAQLSTGDPQRACLVERETSLLARYHAQWSEPLKRLTGWTEFRRGLIETVNCDAHTFLARSQELFRLAPIRHIRFLDVGSSLDRLMNASPLSLLTAITIYAQHIDGRLPRALVDSPHLDRLESLNIGKNRVGDRGVEAIAWSPRLRELKALDISDNMVGDGAANALAGSSNLANLELLQLRRNDLTRAGLGYLCASPTLGRLRQLGMAQNHLHTPRDWTPREGGNVQLESLDMTENGLTGDAAGVVRILPGLANLKRLDLGHNEIGNVGAEALAEWRGAGKLHFLRLTNNRIGDDGAVSLARSNYLHQLVELDLSDNPLHDPGAFAFLNGPSPPRLQRLTLPTLGLTPQIRRALAVRYSG
ncbi:MAG TPA: TIGR02996 domain-containing protein [Gemmataceae bacterium]|jgi:uncharacterized protein (TIGR02996 family)|nr:TIGR02996 domain-containing protein [Gemmataceae bacterium]